MARLWNRSSSELITYGHLSAADGVSRLAISLWIYPTGSVNYDTFLSQLTADNANGLSLLHEAGVAGRLFVTFRNASSAPYAQYNTAFTVNAWNHLCVQYDGSQAGAARVASYVNTTLLTLSVGVDAPTTLPTTTVPLRLGVDGGTQYWSGRLAEVGIWTGVVLSPSERAALAAGLPPDQIQRQALQFYDDLRGAPTNRVTGIGGTPTGTVLIEHPPFVQPRPVRRRYWHDIGIVAGQTFEAAVTATGTTTAALQTRTWLTPSADVTDGSWTPSAGGSDLFAMVNDGSDSTYIRSNSGTGTDTCELDFPSMGVPETGPVTFTIRHRVV